MTYSDRARRGRERRCTAWRGLGVVAALALGACSAGEDTSEPALPEDEASPASQPSGGSEATEPTPDQTSAPQVSEGVGLDESDETPSGDAALDPSLFAFVDPDSGVALTDVYDASRQVLHFSTESGMTDPQREANDPRWTADGNDLFFDRSGASQFQIRFGTEDGVRRAYFTERGDGTICRIRLNGVDRAASISRTSELPPQGA